MIVVSIEKQKCVNEIATIIHNEYKDLLLNNKSLRRLMNIVIIIIIIIIIVIIIIIIKLIK